MDKTTSKRGRPRKADDRVKAEYLDIRLLAAEKQAFRDAADLAGLDLSAWVRERLRMLARKELEAAGQPVAFLGKAVATEGKNNVPEQIGLHLTNAHCIDASSVELTFADGLVACLTLTQLGLADGEVDLRTAKSTAVGLAVKPVKGRRFVIESDTLRYIADPMYAAKIDQSIRDLHLTPAEQEEVSRLSTLTRDPRWNDVGDEDALFE